MSQKDWEEVQQIIDDQSSGLFEKFLASEQIFLPNESMPGKKGLVIMITLQKLLPPATLLSLDLPTVNH